MKAFFLMAWDSMKMYLLVGALIVVAVIAVGTFVPGARPAITWIFETLRTVVEAMFWFFSIPWQLIA